MKEHPETHQTGVVILENTDVVHNFLVNSETVDFGIQIAEDGRVWVCINGIAFIRFKPLKEVKR